MKLQSPSRLQNDPTAPLPANSGIVKISLHLETAKCSVLDLLLFLACSPDDEIMHRLCLPLTHEPSKGGTPESRREGVVLAGVQQGPGAATSCKISSSSWLNPSASSFQSSFTGVEEGGVAGRGTRHSTAPFIISSCPRLALPSGTVPQEVFTLSSSSATLPDPMQQQPKNGSASECSLNPLSTNPCGTIHNNASLNPALVRRIPCRAAFLYLLACKELTKTYF